MTKKYALITQERNTIIAALRYWQRHGIDAVESREAFNLIYDEGFDALDNEQIDSLIENNLNT